MAGPAEAFVTWLHARQDDAEQLLVGELAAGPRHAFLQNSSQYAVDFFSRVDRWRRWSSGLNSGLYRRVAHAQHLADDAKARFDEKRLLCFEVLAGNQRIAFDLRDRARFSFGDGYQHLRASLERGREEPSWSQVLQSMLREVRSYFSMIEGQVSDLELLAAEPQPPDSKELENEPTTTYECRDRLGEGAYGEAWRARDLMLNRDVAVKFIRETGAEHAAIVEHARALARVTAPTIVAVHHIAKVKDPTTGVFLDAMIMELVDGVALSERLGTMIGLPLARQICMAVLDAISAYHDRGWAHFDLHDGNVIVGDRSVKVIDPMYVMSVAVNSDATRVRAQAREVRRARDIIVDVLRSSDVSFDAVFDFERAVAHADLAELRVQVALVFDAPRASGSTPPAGGSDRTRENIVHGFEPGPTANTARAIITALCTSSGGPHGSILSLEAFSRDRGEPVQLVRDAASLLSDEGLIFLMRMNHDVGLTRAGREEAHRLGESVQSPERNYERLVRFLASYGDGDEKGHMEVESSVLLPALALTFADLKDAGDLLRERQMGDMVLSVGPHGPNALIQLNARGRRSGRTGA